MMAERDGSKTAQEFYDILSNPQPYVDEKVSENTWGMVNLASLFVGMPGVGSWLYGKLFGKAAGNNIVYHSVKNGMTEYVGITNNLARRAAEHLAQKGINIQPLMKKLSRADARSVEQALIEIHGLGKNGGTLLNKINSISSKNPIYAESLQRGYDLLKTIGY